MEANIVLGFGPELWIFSNVLAPLEFSNLQYLTSFDFNISRICRKTMLLLLNEVEDIKIQSRQIRKAPSR
ncbi:hypothetical protein WAI453_007667 [Rhynchosporium graminicola]